MCGEVILRAERSGYDLDKASGLQQRIWKKQAPLPIFGL